MKQFIRVMKALSDPNRVRIIKILETKQLCVCELQDLVGLAQSTVSKHLKVLEEAGLVDYHKEGSWFIYRLSEGEESDYAGAMLERMKDKVEEEENLAQAYGDMAQVNTSVEDEINLLLTDDTSAASSEQNQELAALKSKMGIQ